MVAWHPAPIFQLGPTLEHSAGGVEDQHSRSCVQTWRPCKSRPVPPHLSRIVRLQDF